MKLFFTSEFALNEGRVCLQYTKVDLRSDVAQDLGGLDGHSNRNIFALLKLYKQVNFFEDMTPWVTFTSRLAYFLRFTAKLSLSGE